MYISSVNEHFTSLVMASMQALAASSNSPSSISFSGRLFSLFLILLNEEIKWFVISIA